MNKLTDNLIISPIVEDKDKGTRIDKFLSYQIPSLSRSQLQRLILGGYVTLDDDTLSDNAYKVKVGETYQIEIPDLKEADPEPENIALDVVYEDDDLIVINKPVGMVVHPAAGAYHGTLVNALLYHCRDNLSGIGGVKRPGIVHRIDKETSGLLVVAKNDFAHHKLSEQFFEHSIERTYIAIVYGLLQPLNGRIEGNIGRSSTDRKKMALVKIGGKTAATNYQVLEAYGSVVSVVKCNLETGRTHQIRVHLSSLGHNLIGDKTYVKSGKTSLKFATEELKKVVNEFPRQALHAQTLGFIHPRTNQVINFEAPLPQDMSNLLSALNFAYKS
ncbi:MAG: RluA family pseudouridine synthase [Alphaproteobacteria bacterium]|nr:RluA family pseudouridine synthase [Alphaproteobacteria bacterium]